MKRSTKTTSEQTCSPILQQQQFLEDSQTIQKDLATWMSRLTTEQALLVERISNLQKKPQ